MDKSGPITIGEYIYHLGKDDKKIYIKATRISDQSDYALSFTPLDNGAYDIIVSTLREIKEDPDNTSLFYKADYESEIDSLIINIMLRSGYRYSFLLAKYIDYKKITTNRLEKHEKILENHKNLLEDHKNLLEDHSRQIAKISELEKIILTMNQNMEIMKTEINTLKNDVESSKYLINLGTVYSHQSYSYKESKIVDVRQIRSMAVSFHLPSLTVRNKKCHKIELEIDENAPRSFQKYSFDIPLDDEKRLGLLNRLKYLSELELKGYSRGCTEGEQEFFNYLGECKNIRYLKIECCDGITNIPDSSIFPKLKNITIKCSPNIKNLDILKKYESLETVQIDKESNNGCKWDNFHVIHV